MEPKFVMRINSANQLHRRLLFVMCSTLFISCWLPPSLVECGVLRSAFTSNDYDDQNDANGLESLMDIFFSSETQSHHKMFTSRASTSFGVDVADPALLQLGGPLDVGANQVGGSSVPTTGTTVVATNVSIEDTAISFLFKVKIYPFKKLTKSSAARATARFGGPETGLHKRVGTNGVVAFGLDLGLPGQLGGFGYSHQFPFQKYTFSTIQYNSQSTALFKSITKDRYLVNK